MGIQILKHFLISGLRATPEKVASLDSVLIEEYKKNGFISIEGAEESKQKKAKQETAQ